MNLFVQLYDFIENISITFTWILIMEKILAVYSFAEERLGSAKAIIIKQQIVNAALPIVL